MRNDDRSRDFCFSVAATVQAVGHGPSKVKQVSFYHETPGHLEKAEVV